MGIGALSAPSGGPTSTSLMADAKTILAQVPNGGDQMVNGQWLSQAAKNYVDKGGQDGGAFTNALAQVANGQGASSTSGTSSTSSAAYNDYANTSSFQPNSDGELDMRHKIAEQVAGALGISEK